VRLDEVCKAVAVGRALPERYGRLTSFTLRHPAIAGIGWGLVLGMWALVLTRQAIVSSVVAIACFGVILYCWGHGGPLRDRVERNYDDSGRRRRHPE
jgi:hypothetical protein